MKILLVLLFFYSFNATAGYVDADEIIGGGGGGGGGDSTTLKDADESTTITTASEKLTFRTSGASRGIIDSNGNVGIGTLSPALTAILDLASTTKGFRAPSMTLVQRDAIASPVAEGLIVYNTTSKAINIFNGTEWVAVGGGGKDYDTLIGNAVGQEDLDTFTGTTIADDSTVKVAIQALETAVELKENITDLDSLIGNANTQTHLGAFTGDTIPDNYSVKAALQEVETEVELKENITDLDSLIGNANTQTHLGAFTGTTISNLSSVKTALQELETAGELKENITDLDTLVGNANGVTNLGAFTGTTIADASSVKTSLQELESTVELKENITDLDTLVGNANGVTNLGVFIGGTITNASSVKVALQELETTVELKENITDLDALIGNANTQTHLGAFTGTTIADNASVKASLQALETELEDLSPDIIKDADGTTKIEADAGTINEDKLRFTAGGAEKMVITAVGVGVGTAAPHASALIDMTSTTKGFKPPSMTTAQRDAIATPVAGLQIYNTSSGSFEYHNGAAWVVFSSGSGGDSNKDADSDTKIVFETAPDDDTIRLSTFGSDRMIIDKQGETLITGSLKIGASGVPNVSTALMIESTTKGFMPPSMTTAERDLVAGPIVGLQIFNNTTNQHEFWNGTVWGPFASGGGGTPTLIEDADQDTKIQVEEAADEDKIRLDIAGNERLLIESNGSAESIVSSGSGNAKVVRSTTITHTAPVGSGFGIEDRTHILNDGGVTSPLARSEHTYLSPITAGAETAIALTQMLSLGSLELVMAKEAGAVTLYPTPTTTAHLRLKELGSNGGNYTGWKAPTALDANIVYQLPSVAPTAGQVLASSAGGVTSWTTPAVVTPASLVFGDDELKLYNDGMEDMLKYVLNGADALQLVQGTMNLYGAATSGSVIRLYEGTNNGTTPVAIRAADNMVSSYSITLPDAQGTAGQTLSNDGSGVLTWATVAAGTPTLIEDADQNTKIQVEEVGNDNVIRFDTNGFERMTITAAGNVGIGAAPESSAILDVRSITQGFRPPSMTTTQRNLISSVVEGLQVYNTTTKKLEFFDGTTWGTVGATSAVGAVISDADFDTRVWVEKTTDDDTIILEAGGLEVMNITKSESVQTYEVPFTNNSVGGHDTYMRSANVVAADFGYANRVSLENDSDAAVIAGERFTTWIDPTAASEDAKIRWRVSTGGTPIKALDLIGGKATVYGNATGGGEIALGELPVNGDNIVGFKAPATLAADMVWTLPATDGTNGQVLTTNGTSFLTWEDSAGTPTLIEDADQNTKIQVEETADENILRFDTAGQQAMSINTAGGVCIGLECVSNDADILLDLRSNTKGFLIPTLTTAERDTSLAFPPNGTIIFNSTLNRIENYAASNWKAVGDLGTHETLEDADKNTRIRVETNANENIIRFSTDGFERMAIGATGNVGFSGIPAHASAILDVSSITQGFRPPYMTTTQRDAITTPAEGLHVYNLTTKALDFHNGTAWGPVGGGGSSGTPILIEDADQNTKIQVEKTANDDVIRFDIAGTEKVTINALGSVGIGTATPDASAILDMSSSTLGFLPPRIVAGDLANLVAPATGLQVYNATTNKNNFYDGTDWVEVASVSSDEVVLHPTTLIPSSAIDVVLDGTQATLTWTAVPKSSYEIFYSETEIQDLTVAPQATSATPDLVVAGLTLGSSYFFYIKAVSSPALAKKIVQPGAALHYASIISADGVPGATGPITVTTSVDTAAGGYRFTLDDGGTPQVIVSATTSATFNNLPRYSANLSATVARTSEEATYTLAAGHGINVNDSVIASNFLNDSSFDGAMVVSAVTATSITVYQKGGSDSPGPNSGTINIPKLYNFYAESLDNVTDKSVYLTADTVSVGSSEKYYVKNVGGYWGYNVPTTYNDYGLVAPRSLEHYRIPTGFTDGPFVASLISPLVGLKDVVNILVSPKKIAAQTVPVWADFTNGTAKGSAFYLETLDTVNSLVLTNPTSYTLVLDDSDTMFETANGGIAVGLTDQFPWPGATTNCLTINQDFTNATPTCAAANAPLPVGLTQVVEKSLMVRFEATNDGADGNIRAWFDTVNQKVWWVNNGTTYSQTFAALGLVLPEEVRVRNVYATVTDGIDTALVVGKDGAGTRGYTIQFNWDANTVAKVANHQANTIQASIFFGNATEEDSMGTTLHTVNGKIFWMESTAVSAANFRTGGGLYEPNSNAGYINYAEGVLGLLGQRQGGTDFLHRVSNISATTAGGVTGLQMMMLDKGHDGPGLFTANGNDDTLTFVDTNILCLPRGHGVW